MGLAIETESILMNVKVLNLRSPASWTDSEIKQAAQRDRQFAIVGPGILDLFPKMCPKIIIGTWNN